MPQPIDGPTTSYSDPFYDRLETVSRLLRQHLVLVLGVIVAAVVLAVVVRQALTSHPEAGSAATFLQAQERAEAARGDRNAAFAAWQAVLADQATTPYFKARAAIELAQVHLLGGEATAARDAARKAADFAKLADDAELTATVSLTRAAAELQAGELDAALASYAEAGRAAGARLPVPQLEAELGQARVLERQGKVEEAIARLEPLVARSDAGAESLLAVAKVRYWFLRRHQAEAALAPAAASAAGSSASAAAAH